MMICIVSAQFSPNGTSDVLRELALLPIDSPLTVKHWIVKPSILFSSLSAKDQRTTQFLERHHHRISWYAGDYTMEDVRLGF